MDERPRQREIEEVLEGRRRERLQIDRRAASYLSIQYGYRPLWHLQQERQLLGRRRWIGHDDLTSVNGLHQELVRNVLVDLLVVDDAVAIVESEEVLAHQHGRFAFGRLGLPDLLVKHDGGTLGDHNHLRVVERDLVFD